MGIISCDSVCVYYMINVMPVKVWHFVFADLVSGKKNTYDCFIPDDNES